MGIKERILARPDLDDLRIAKDITGLALGLNARPPMIVASRYITARTILVECPSGSEIIAALNSIKIENTAVGVALNFLYLDSGIDIGNIETLSMIDVLVNNGTLTYQHCAELKAMATRPEYVTQEQVADAMYYPDGTEK